MTNMLRVFRSARALLLVSLLCSVPLALAGAPARAQTDVTFDIPIPPGQNVPPNQIKICAGSSTPITALFQPAGDVTAYGSYAITSDDPSVATATGAGA